MKYEVKNDDYQDVIRVFLSIGHCIENTKLDWWNKPTKPYISDKLTDLAEFELVINQFAVLNNWFN